MDSKIDLIQLRNALKYEHKFKETYENGEKIQVVIAPAENGVTSYIFDKDGKFLKAHIEYSIGYTNRKHKLDHDVRVIPRKVD